MRGDIVSTNNISSVLQYEIMASMLKSIASEGSSDDSIGSSSDQMNVFDTLLQSLANSAKSSSGTLNPGSELLSIHSASNTAAATSKTNFSNETIGIEQAVNSASQKYGVDKNLINSVIEQESSFNPSSTSSAGAMGLMQLMPSTASELGVANAYDISQNVDGGTKYLKSLLNTFGNYKLAIAAYNAGPGAVKKSGGDISKLPSETRNYVNKVSTYYNNQNV